MSRAPQSAHSATHQIFATQQQYGRQDQSLPPLMPESTILGSLPINHQPILPSGKPNSKKLQTSNPIPPPPAYQHHVLPLSQSSPALQFQQHNLQQLLQPRDSLHTNEHQSSSLQAVPTLQPQTFSQRDPVTTCQQSSTSVSLQSANSSLPMMSMIYLMNPYLSVGASAPVVSSTHSTNTQSAIRFYSTNRTEPQVHQGTDGSSSMRSSLLSAHPNSSLTCNPVVLSSALANLQSYILPVQPTVFPTTASEQLHTLGQNYQKDSLRSAQSESSRIPDGTFIKIAGGQCSIGMSACNNAANTYHNITGQSNFSTSQQQSVSQNNIRPQNMGICHMIPVGETNQGSRFVRLDTLATTADAFTDSMRSVGTCNMMSTQESNKATSRASVSTTKQHLISHPLQIPNEVPFIVPPNWNPAAAAALHSHGHQEDSEDDRTSVGLLGRWYRIPGMEQENTSTCLPTQTNVKDNESSSTGFCTEKEIISPCVSNSFAAQMPNCTSISTTNVTSSNNFISTSTTNVTSSSNFISILPLSLQVKSKSSTPISSVPPLTETVTVRMKPSTSDFSLAPSILTDAIMKQNTQVVASSDATCFPGSSHVTCTLNNSQVQVVTSVPASLKAAGFSGQEAKLIKNEESFVPCPGFNSLKETNMSSVSPTYNCVHQLGRFKNVTLSGETEDQGVKTMNPKDLSQEELTQKISEIDSLISQSRLQVAKKHSGIREISNEMQSKYPTKDNSLSNALIIGKIGELESQCSKYKTIESVASPMVSAENKEENIGSDRHVIISDCASNISVDETVAPVTESLSSAASQADNENGVSSSGLGICILNTFSLADVGKRPKETCKTKNTPEGKENERKRKLSDEIANSSIKKSKQSCNISRDDDNNSNECIDGKMAVSGLTLEKGSKTNTDIKKFHIGNVQEVLEISEDEDNLEDVAKKHKQTQSAEKQCESESPLVKTAGDNAVNVEGSIEGEIDDFTTHLHIALIDSFPSEMKSCFNIVTFHNQRLLQVEIESKKFFIMKELLNKCFENFKQRNYFRVFKAKEYHLKIPVIDLPKKFKPYAIQYLELIKILQQGQSNPDKYISVIEQNNAERLYNFDFSKITMNSLSKNAKDVGVVVHSQSQNARQERLTVSGSNNSSVPAPPKNMPASIKGAPAPPKDMPASLKGASALPKDKPTPAPPKDIPASLKGATAPPKDKPTPAPPKDKPTPAPPKDMPASLKGATAPPKDMHVPHKDMSAPLNNIPAHLKSALALEVIILDDPVVITSSDSETSSCVDSVDSDCTLPYVDGKATPLKRRKNTKTSRPLKKKEHNRKDRQERNKTDICESGTMEVNGISTRYVCHNNKRYIPFEDLTRSFPQVNIYSYLKEGKCPMINYPSFELNIFNHTDVSLPKLGKNPILVEYDSFQSLVPDLYESASPVRSGSQKKQHTEKSTAKKLLTLYSKTLQKLKDSCLPPNKAESSGKDDESCQLHHSDELRSSAATNPTVTGDRKNSPKLIKASSKMVRRLESVEGSNSSASKEKSAIHNKSLEVNNMSQHTIGSPTGSADKSNATTKDHRSPTGNADKSNATTKDHRSPTGSADKSNATTKDHRMIGYSSQNKTSSASKELTTEQIRQAMLNKPYVLLERLSPFVISCLMGNNTKLMTIKFPLKTQKENSTTVTKCFRHINSDEQRKKTVPLEESSLPIQDFHQGDDMRKPAESKYLRSENDTVCSISVCESIGLVNQKSENTEISRQCQIINCKDSRNVSTPGGNLIPEDGLQNSIDMQEAVQLEHIECDDRRKIVSFEAQNEPGTVDRKDHDTGRNIPGTDIAFDGRKIVRFDIQNEPATVDRKDHDTGRNIPETDITGIEHADIDSNTNHLLNEDGLQTSSDQSAVFPVTEHRDNSYSSVLEEIQNLIDEGKKGSETTDVNVFPSDYSDHEDLQASLSNALGLTTSRLHLLGRPLESREGDQFFRIGEQFDNILLTESISVDSLQNATILAFQEQSQLNTKLAASCQTLRTVVNQIQRS